MLHAAPMLARQNSEPLLNALEPNQALDAWGIGYPSRRESSDASVSMASSSAWRNPSQQVQHQQQPANQQAPDSNRDATLMHVDLQQPLQGAHGRQAKTSGRNLFSSLLKGRRRTRVHQDSQRQSGQ